MSDSRTSFYLDKRNAKVSGVLAGIADYFDVDPLFV
ncbi:MAG: PspC domain-containing protein, partial [Sphingomonadaceae bacterium]|nr:PspC domain-containing protein [Sphingomonadaceae bacterium]